MNEKEKLEFDRMLNHLLAKNMFFTQLSCGPAISKRGGIIVKKSKSKGGNSMFDSFKRLFDEAKKEGLI